jgi:methionine-rich copper-binding protein CopC
MKRVLALLLVLPLTALAHTTLLSSVPKSGSELTESPATIELQFREAAKLTTVTVTGTDKHARKLQFALSDKPNTYIIAKPALTPGTSEVKWSALSRDGHVITGKLTFLVEPKTK